MNRTTSSTFPRGAGALLPFIAFLIILLPASPAVGQTAFLPEDTTAPQLQPYLVMVSGLQVPVEDAYNQVFSGPLFRYGGGFGLHAESFGAEVLLRAGSNRESMNIDSVLRIFTLKETEIQVRLYGIAHYKRFSTPFGAGFGLVSMTVDRGYPGIWDKFKGDGLFVAPFVGLTFHPTKSLSVGVEVEYPFSETTFSGSEAWYNQFNNLEGTFPMNNATEASFWDTVGGLEKKTYDNRGFVYSLRFVFNLPVYQER